ncbi:hypothetical protein O181_015649 [Austropuccinia psidii MF-1]|uniref:Retrotransposon gag domain-containing protein n=1 Tax=Austropuccinia psidii MF-1 TaxID=1389203 RepID=A0A9Q3C0B1_9BASI|nr:hypothetical protein [Austropuccinia psidii MF-1]
MTQQTSSFKGRRLFTLFGDPNEVRKAEQELENLRIKESGKVSLYIADLRSLMSRIGDWGERAYIHVYRRGLASRFLDQLASHPGNFDSLQELMDITLELDTRYHERQKEKCCSDEVFKEIKDVGEDVSISSLHLLQGDGDLPCLSFHASLEEQWDEEEKQEEIEAVLKVVPPAYHQYLDLFSKVRAEKPPPHHACDHYIQLDGLLPPVCVIYSLSKNESEIIRAYISENVEKGFIRPSCSSTGAPVLFVEKKDGGLPFCVDYRKLNDVTRKNRYPVPPMNQALTIFNSSTIFSKIDFHGAHNILRIKEGERGMST